MAQIEYSTINLKNLGEIHDLWFKLNEHHKIISRYFQKYYEGITFEDRKKQYESIVSQGGILKIDLAKDKKNGVNVGYCISSISKDGVGEILSIFVDELYRSQKIGSTLMNHALLWMNSRGVTKKRVIIAYGNESLWTFYRKFHFYPWRMIFEQKEGG